MGRVCDLCQVGVVAAGARFCCRRCASLWKHHRDDPAALAVLRAGGVSPREDGQREVRLAEEALAELRAELAADRARARGRPVVRYRTLAEAEVVDS